MSSKDYHLNNRLDLNWISCMIIQECRDTAPVSADHGKPHGHLKAGQMQTGNKNEGGLSYWAKKVVDEIYVVNDQA